jgi:hypothetical protein
VSVSRRVEFFAALTEAGEDGVQPPYDPRASIREIARLDLTDQYWHLGERVYRLWARNDGQGGMLGLVRHSALPPVDHGDHIEQLDLGDAAGIIEQMFFRVFDGRYVGVVRNQLGPRVGRLADYLEARSPDHFQPVEFMPMARADTVEQLQRIRDLRRVKLKVRRAGIAALQDEQTVYDVLSPAAERAGDAQTVELEFSVGRRKNANLGAALTRAVRRLSGRDDIGELASTFHIAFGDDDGDRHEVNVLDDRLVSWETIDTTAPEGGGLSDQSAYGALNNAYESLRDDIEAASPIQALNEPQ